MWTKYKLTIQFTEPMLGTIPKNQEVYTRHVKHQLAGEDEQIPEPQEVEEKGWTGFHVDNEGRPVMFDYMVKGFLKEAGNVIKEEVKVKNLRSHVEQSVFVFPRMTVLADKVDGYLERPLRAMTQQGPRVTVVRSDKIEPGREYTFEVRVLNNSKVTQDVLEAILSYGELKGLGQWRNGGFGRFTAKLEKVTDSFI